jgi:hypothetical protein
MLPFLKNRKTPRIATEPQEEKLVNGSQDDHIEDQMSSELFDACQSKDASKFRSALEALVMNCFDFDGDENATDEE